MAERVGRGVSFVVLVFAAAILFVFLGCLLGVAVAGEPCECAPCDPLSASISRLENLESRLYVLQDRGRKGEFVFGYILVVEQDIRGIPVQIHPNNNRFSDIGMVSYTDEKNELHSRYFIINASIGITADANQLFNQGDLFIRTMKSRFVGVTILYTALRTLATYKNKDVIIMDNGKSQELRVANISITKSPYISGSFHYDMCPARDSGKLGFHCSGDMTRWEIIKTLMDLSKGKYSGSPKRETEYLEKIRISSDLSMALETDGEVQMGRDFTFSVLPGAICLAS